MWGRPLRSPASPRSGRHVLAHGASCGKRLTILDMQLFFLLPTLLKKSSEIFSKKSMLRFASKHASFCLNPCIVFPQTMRRFFQVQTSSSNTQKILSPDLIARRRYKILLKYANFCSKTHIFHSKIYHPNRDYMLIQLIFKRNIRENTPYNARNLLESC